MLEITGLTVDYGAVRALDDVDLQVDEVGRDALGCLVQVGEAPVDVLGSHLRARTGP